MACCDDPALKSILRMESQKERIGAIVTGNPRVADLAARSWDELLETYPTLGTLVGDERFDDRLPAPSEAGRDREADVLSRGVEAARALVR